MSGPERHSDLVEASLARPPRRSMVFVQRLLGGFFLLLMAALLGAVAWWTYVGAARDATEAGIAFARLAANQAARMVESADLLLIDMQRIGRVADWDSAAVAALAQGELELLAAELPHVVRLTVFGPDGRVRASSDPAREPREPVVGRGFFTQQARGGNDLYIGPLRRAADGAPEFVMSRTVTGPGETFEGIVAVALDPEVFRTFYRSLDLPSRTVLQLVHADLSVIVREPTSAQDGAPALGPEIRRRVANWSEHAIFRYVDSAGRERIGATHAVENYPLHVVLGIERAAVIERWMADTLPYFAFGCLALLALAFLVSLSIRQGHREDLFRTALMRSNEALEHRVRERTSSLEDALEQKDVLFRELNHRVKNNLQIVTSLLRLQAGRFKDPAVAEGFTSCLGRIQSMSAVHEMLYRKDDIAHVDFREYLGGLARRLGESYGAAGRVGVDVSADDDRLDIRTAVPLALFVNEVMSNSFKHAFPDGRTGSITIEYRVDGDMRTLTARDDGVGVDPAGRPGSLGMQLARALAGQLGGAFRQGPGNPGTVTTMEFNLAAVADD